MLLVYIAGFAPAIWMFSLALLGDLGADPVSMLEQGLGIWALRYMIACLSITPLRKYTGLNLIYFRRCLGLTAFYFSTFHLFVYLSLDRQLSWKEIGGDMIQRPHIMFGMIAFVLLLPLALTSTDRAVCRLGVMIWRRLHRLTYLSATIMILHYLWVVKSWTIEPLAYALVVMVLLTVRLLPAQED